MIEHTLAALRAAEIRVAEARLAHEEARRV